MRHSETGANCQGELRFKRRLLFAGEEYEEYQCSKCKKWIYLPVSEATAFKFETKIRI
jgi:hypothetical protein